MLDEKNYNVFTWMLHLVLMSYDTFERVLGSIYIAF